VGGAFGGVGEALFFAKLLVSIGLVALLLYAPGWMARDRGPAAAGAAPAKSVIDRFLEVLVGYVLIGTLGFTMELDLGNAFPQRWEFYAVTLALFLVLGYPGFVWRYMLQRRRR
jgi:hypothetical protein